MVTVFLGIGFIINAILHGLGNPHLIQKKYREEPWRKVYQKGLVIPYSIVGVGFVVWGSVFNSFEEQSTTWYCIGLVLIAIVPLFLLIKNKRKFPM